MEQSDKSFIGEYFHTIDAKGRLIVPAKYRERLGEVFVVNKGNEGCLTFYTLDSYEKYVAKLNQLPETKAVRLYRRIFLSSSVHVEMDKQGRILLPASHRAYAGLDKEVVFTGANDKIELWNKDKWEETMSDVDYDALSEEVANLTMN